MMKIDLSGRWQMRKWVPRSGFLHRFPVPSLMIY